MDMKLISTIAVFSASAFISGYLLAKKKYQALEQEGVESVKQSFKDKCKNCEYSAKKATATPKKNVTSDNSDVAKTTNSNDNLSAQKIEYNKLAEKYRVKGDEDMDGNIYVIPPDVFGDTGYEVMSLTLYNNGVLVDDVKQEVVKNPEKLVGKEYTKYFGNYDEPDRVCVRNDTKKLDIEILSDIDDYEE